MPRGADRRVDALQAGELLRAAARLLRSLPGAEAVDVLLGAGDLLLLAVCGTREGRVAVGSLARVVRVAAAILDDLRSPRGGLEREGA